MRTEYHLLLIYITSTILSLLYSGDPIGEKIFKIKFNLDLISIKLNQINLNFLTNLKLLEIQF